jgi:ankyrin repeat protein
MLARLLTWLYRFRWVFCQLDALQHCFPQNLRQFLDELPETLDETYERILKGINKTQRDDARRLLHCLVAAVRPLYVEELAEILAFDFQVSTTGGIPILKEDWRWDNQEEAILSTCPSLVTIVHSNHARVVQFSHFSVKEYLTSPRLARSPYGDVSRFHITRVPAHTVMAQACLGTLLRLDDNNGVAKGPLVEYAAQHWADHAQIEEVSSRVRYGMDHLFDSSRPYFSAWLREYDIDERWSYFSFGVYAPPSRVGSPLYYAAFCGLYDLAERLIMKHPEQVNAPGGHILAPLPAALYKKHFGVANLLRVHGAIVDIRGLFKWTPLHVASLFGRIDIIRWLLKNGADSNARTSGGSSWTPLHIAVHPMEVEPILALLEHNADINSQCTEGKTPLYEAISLFASFPEGIVVDIVRRLLEHGADTNIRDHRDSTVLHQALSRGWLEVARLLLQHGANVDEEDRKGRTPLQIASAEGYDDITKLLLEHSAVPQT